MLVAKVALKFQQSTAVKKQSQGFASVSMTLATTLMDAQKTTKKKKGCSLQNFETDDLLKIKAEPFNLGSSICFTLKAMGLNSSKADSD